MKNKLKLTTIVIILYILFTLVGCTTTKYIPVEKIKIEYRNNIERDTLIVKDSVLHKEKGDTIFIEKYKVLYKTKFKTDTILRIDTVPIIKEVQVYREVNKIKHWQKTLMIIGALFIALVVFKIFKFFKK